MHVLQAQQLIPDIVNRIGYTIWQIAIFILYELLTLIFFLFISPFISSMI